MDYSDTEVVQKTLQEHNVEVVISALALFAEESAKAQMDLINAAINAGSVKRFIPSEYGINYSHPGLIEFHPAAKWWLDAADVLRDSHLDFTRIIFGWLSDHYGYPKRTSHMKPFNFAVDFSNRRAALPGDGNAAVTYLHSVDIAKYVAALIDDEKKWPETSAFASDKLTWNELIKLAEEVMGELLLYRLRRVANSYFSPGEKWTVTYEPLEKLEKGEATVLPQPPDSYDFTEDAARAMIAEFGIMAVKGVMDVSREGLRNEDYPQVKPISVRKILEDGWGK